MAEASRARLRALSPIVVASGILFAVYFSLACFVLPLRGFYSPDTTYKFLQLLSLRWRAGLHASLPYPGHTLDPFWFSVPLGDSFFSVRNDQLHLVWPPWFALLGRPAYVLLGFHGLHVIPACAAAACAAISGALAGIVAGRASRPWAVLLAGLATPLLIYGLLVWEHALAALFATLGTWQWLTALRGDRRPRALLAGTSFALACALRAELLLLVLALGAASLSVRHRLALTTSPWTKLRSALTAFLLTSAPFLAWNLLTTGRLSPSNSRNFDTPSFAYLSQAQANVLLDFVWGQRGALAAVALAATTLLLVVSRLRAPLARERSMLVALAILVPTTAVLTWSRLRDPSLGSLHGTLEAAPFVLLGLCASPAEKEEPNLALQLLLQRALLCYGLLYLVAISLLGFVGPDGGKEWGPRFLLPAYPLLVPLFMRFWSRPGARPKLQPWLRAGLALLVILSCAMQARGIAVIRRDELRSLHVGQMLRTVPAREPLIATEWWLPGLLTEELLTRQVFVVRNPLTWADILRRAAARGERRVWLVGTRLPTPSFVEQSTPADLVLEPLSSTDALGLELRSFSLRCKDPVNCVPGFRR